MLERLEDLTKVVMAIRIGELRAINEGKKYQGVTRAELSEIIKKLNNDYNFEIHSSQLDKLLRKADRYGLIRTQIISEEGKLIKICYVDPTAAEVYDQLLELNGLLEINRRLKV